MMRKLTLASLAATLIVASVATQSKNAALLGRFSPSNGAANDVWGFEDPKTGKPYCMLLTTSGTYILDVSNPASPKQTGYFAASLSGWRTSSWRDAKYWKGYGYVVTESGGGMQVLDLTNPDRPTYKGTTTASGWRNTHNIAFDFEKGHAYCCGSTGSLTRVYDVDTTPGTPIFIANIGAPYLHDLDVNHGILHGADIYGNNYRILDVSKLPTVTFLSSVAAPGTRYCHNNWATHDNQYSVTTNESAGGPIAFWDVRDLKNPKLIAQYRANNSQSAIPHNAYILDYVVHASHYTEGYRAIDMSTPTKPVEVGYYDTWPGSSSGYNGNWGCYPFARSGIQYVSDRSTGLYLVKPLASARRYGAGTKGTNGKVPHLHLKGAAWLGNTSFAMGVRDAKASSAMILAIGGKAADVTVGGLQILVDLVSPAPFLFATATDAAGASLVPVPVPNDNSLNGAQINLQAFVVDAGSSSIDLAASEGLEFTIFKN